jgi:UDP-MurNAc hydroxylase
MKFQIVSHACLLVESSGTRLLCDPWITGSAYWRSWWNFPPIKDGLLEELRPSAIYLSHIHWDHFHGHSLRRFDRGTPVFVPYDRYDRIVRDLAALGFREIVRLRHARRHEIAPGFALTSYHFSPFTDSALVVEAEGYTLFDANDAKFMGLPLAQILRRHPRIDFALRSHSSASSRPCYAYLDAPNAPVDDNDRYIESFCHFMAKVAPDFAIPFASNHCYLHRDAYAFNALVQTPDAVAKRFEAFRAERGLRTEVRVMLSGDWWSSESGFHIAPSEYVVARDAKLLDYAASKAATLEKYYAAEARVHVPKSLLDKFFAEFSRAIPRIVRRRYKDRPIVYDIVAGDAHSYVAFDLCRGIVTESDAAGFATASMRVVIPAMVCRQALALNMFAHAAISKRVRFFATQADMKRLLLLDTLLACYEYELLPLRKLLRREFFVSYLARWRELLLYAQLAWALARGTSITAFEERFFGEQRKSATRPPSPPLPAGSAGG